MPHFCEALHSLGLLDRFEEGISEEKENAQIAARGLEKPKEENPETNPVTE